MANARRGRTQPQQQRSRVTETRFLDTLARLLQSKPWSKISVEEIADEAGLSIGAFYKRFAKRDDVLIALVERTQRDFEKSKADIEACEGSLSERIEVLIDALAKGWIEQRAVVQAAVASGVGSGDQALAADARSRLAWLQAFLLARRAEITHPDPELAVRLGLYFVLQPLQALLLQPNTPVPAEALVREAKQLLRTYLSCR